MSKEVKFGIFLSVQHSVGDSLTQRFQEAMEQLRFAREAGFDLVRSQYNQDAFLDREMSLLQACSGIQG